MPQDKKICLITGASSGIGYAIARALSREGYKLILSARRENKLKELESEFVDILPGDLTSATYQDTVEEYIYKKYGRPK